MIIACIVRVWISIRVQVEHLCDGHVFYVRCILLSKETKIIENVIDKASLSEGNVFNCVVGGDLWVQVNSQIVQDRPLVLKHKFLAEACKQTVNNGISSGKNATIISV